ncbi:MAG: DUF3108 domain-containing protein [Burkholderiales bacterium]
MSFTLRTIRTEAQQPARPDITPSNATVPVPVVSAGPPAVPQITVRSAAAGLNMDPVFLSPVIPTTLADIEYAVTRSDWRDQQEVRRMHFESDNPGHYRLSEGISESSLSKQPLGGNRYLEVTGKLSSNGLTPEELYEQGRQDIDTDGGQQSDRHVSITESGAIDRISLYYQFMFAPPRMGDAPKKLLITDGERTQTYTQEVLGLEMLTIGAMGQHPTIHLRLVSSDSAGSTELWLAPAYRYLPLKIRQTSASGITYEQEAVSLLVR